jgi:hypothetical protein
MLVLPYFLDHRADFDGFEARLLKCSGFDEEI